MAEELDESTQDSGKNLNGDSKKEKKKTCMQCGTQKKKLKLKIFYKGVQVYLCNEECFTGEFIPALETSPHDEIAGSFMLLRMLIAFAMYLLVRTFIITYRCFGVRSEYLRVRHLRPMLQHLRRNSQRRRRSVKPATKKSRRADTCAHVWGLSSRSARRNASNSWRGSRHRREAVWFVRNNWDQAVRSFLPSGQRVPFC